jgi:four helix bundle protein
MTADNLRSLAVYRHSVSFAGHSRALVVRLRPSDPALADQFHRAGISIALNIAEGAGEFSSRDKARFYRYALRSCTETTAMLDVLREIELIEEAEYARLSGECDRITAMLTRLVIVTVGRKTGRQGAHARNTPVPRDPQLDSGRRHDRA